jgi:carbamoyltransferase
MGNELDLLVVGNCLLRKSEQDTRLKIDYRASLNED